MCVELVRKLELSGCGIEEVGVHHYPRRHGQSQFFRVRSLAATLCQLIRLYFGLVVLPWLQRGILRRHASTRGAA